jgi:hypothetical protein
MFSGFIGIKTFEFIKDNNWQAESALSKICFAGSSHFQQHEA